MLNEGKWVGLARFWNPGICVSSLTPIAMINLYCDESQDEHTYSLAGWIAEPHVWDRIHEQWCYMLCELKMPEFHASEIVGREYISDSRFKHWTFEDEKIAFTRAVSILIDPFYSNLFAFGCSISIPPKEGTEFGFETENTIWMALFCQFLATLARDFLENKNVNLMFDEKRGMRDTVNNYFYKARVRVNKHLPEYFSRSPVGFAASERTIPLQAADLLAYEWRRRISEKEKQPDKNVRTSYAILRKHRKAFLHHINRDNWNDLELRSAKDASKFIDLLMNCEGTEE